jgi:hypothetical protein
MHYIRSIMKPAWSSEVLVMVSCIAALACNEGASQPPPAVPTASATATASAPPNGYAPNGYPPNGYPPNGYPPNGYAGTPPPNGPPPNGPPPNGPPPNGPPPPTASAPPPPPPTASVATAPPLPTTLPTALPSSVPLPPLLGTPALQAEVRLVLDELIRNLTPERQKRVVGIPLKFETDPNELNAYAGCDEKGTSYMAATQGMLDAIDGMSQTKATDELFGTQTYDAYTAAAIPKLNQPKGGSAALPLGIIPLAYAADPRRLSRAHEIADEVIAFTFGHELAHHYLGHTGCANGSTQLQQGLAVLGHLGTKLVPLFNQPNELAADNLGLFNVLDSGRARRPMPQWTEKGGLLLLDFFARLERAAGATPLVAFLQSHPPSKDRIAWVQGFASSWRQQQRP